MKRLILILALAWLGHAAPVLAETGKRLALVIGNSVYAHVPALTNPANDAADIAAALDRLGFDVTLGLDADNSRIRALLTDFATRAETADLSLVYYAGHGIEVDQTNYLIPVDARLQRDNDVDFEALPLDLVMRALVGAGGIKIVLVDACRDNPFAAKLQGAGGTRSIGTGLGRVDPIGGVRAGGILVGYAAREGTVALDGQGRNSPYAQALLEHLEEPGLEVSKLFRKVRDRVFDLTGGRQEPFTYGALPGKDFYFIAPPALAAFDPDDMTRRFAIVEKDGSLWSWRSFLDRYGAQVDHPLVAIAQRRYDNLLSEDAHADALRPARPWMIPERGLPEKGALDLTPAEISRVQRSLMYMGFDPGGADGNLGPQTRKAIAAARLDRGLQPGAFVDYALLTELPDVDLVENLMTGKLANFDDVDLPHDLEPRLRKALEALSGSWLTFGYFEGRLYLAVYMESGHWRNANDAAQSTGGHLVTIASAAENAFVSRLFSDEQHLMSTDQKGSVKGPFIGLYQADTSIEPAGGWVWVTGEPVTYSSWSRGQPDNWNGTDSYARYYWPSDVPRNGRLTNWDDTFGPGSSYIIEIE